ncbi:MAG: acetyl-CoA carboxylase biotin carboxyl carrier protein subunit [Dissulfuribacterales bacterium]
MQRRIDLLDKHYNVTVTGRPDNQQLQVETGERLTAALISTKNGENIIKLGDQSASVELAVKGETAYIHAFGRTFTLSIVDPVEQASQDTGGKKNTARAPMPGIVVNIDVNAGDRVTRGQPMMTIESMKILTVITAPRDGEVAQIHFKPGDTFSKNDALITLTKSRKEKKQEE